MAAWLMIAILLPIGSGCGHLPRFRLWPTRPEPCTFNSAATKQEIVAHVNRFATSEGARPPLTAWRALQAKVTFAGTPTVPATVDVEAPSRVRIRAVLPFSNSEVADIGCNHEELWFWHRMSPKEIVTIKHENVPYALQQMQVPIEPQWLMEVLGVVPMNVDDFVMRPVSDHAGNMVDLVAERATPTGETVSRVVRFDLCHGRIVEHRIERADGTLVACATLGGYSPDASAQYVMPHVVQIEWPSTGAALKLEVGPILANPTPLADAEWRVPQYAGVQQMEFIPPGRGPRQTADPRASWQEPLYREAAIDTATRMDVLSDAGSAAAPPEAYSPAASQSSSDRLPPEPESGPRPFPSRL
jgi:hypothetical protein